MQLGDHAADQDTLHDILDKLNNNVNELITAVESGGLDQLSAEEKVAVWQRFERTRNRLPLIDHGLIAAAEAADLAREYCSSTMTQFLVRVLQLSHGEAASRVRAAAAAVRPRSTMLGEKLQPQLPRLATLQRDGFISPEKVTVVERAMDKLSRPDLDPHAVQTAEELLTDYAPVLGYSELRRYAVSVVNAADPDGPQPVDDQLQQDRRHVELKPRRDGMWHLAGRRTNTVGAQLNAILDPLTKPRTTARAIDRDNLEHGSNADHVQERNLFF